MDARVRIILKLIEDHPPSVQFNLASASGSLGVSEAHILRLFHRDLGKPFRQYLRNARMMQAARLLQDNALSIKHVAYACGYSDLANFYRDFKMVHRQTPRQVRLGFLKSAYLSSASDLDS